MTTTGNSNAKRFFCSTLKITKVSHSTVIQVSSTEQSLLYYNHTRVRNVINFFCTKNRVIGWKKWDIGYWKKFHSFPPSHPLHAPSDFFIATLVLQLKKLESFQSSKFGFKYKTSSNHLDEHPLF